MADAIAKKDVIEVEEDGKKMYYFPRKKIGLEEQVQNKKAMQAQKKAEQSSVEMAKDLLESVAWKIESAPKEPMHMCTWSPSNLL